MKTPLYTTIHCSNSFQSHVEHIVDKTSAPCRYVLEEVVRSAVISSRWMIDVIVCCQHITVGCSCCTSAGWTRRHAVIVWCLKTARQPRLKTVIHAQSMPQNTLSNLYFWTVLQGLSLVVHKVVKFVVGIFWNNDYFIAQLKLLVWSSTGPSVSLSAKPMGYLA
jgi:ribosomal protein L30E